MNEHQSVFYLNCGTQHFSSLSYDWSDRLSIKLLTHNIKKNFFIFLFCGRNKVPLVALWYNSKCKPYCSSHEPPFQVYSGRSSWYQKIYSTHFFFLCVKRHIILYENTLNSFLYSAEARTFNRSWYFVRRWTGFRRYESRASLCSSFFWHSWYTQDTSQISF